MAIRARCCWRWPKTMDFARFVSRFAQIDNDDDGCCYCLENIILLTQVGAVACCATSTTTTTTNNGEQTGRYRSEFAMTIVPSQI